MREPDKQEIVLLLFLNKNGPHLPEVLQKRLHLGVGFKISVDRLITANWVSEAADKSLVITDDGKAAIKLTRHR